MGTRLRVRGACVAATMVVAVAAVACSNAPASSGTNAQGSGGTTASTAGPGPSGTFPAVNQPGVSATEIKVAGVASATNPLGASYGSAFDGTQAYFDMINSQGGIYGRKLTLSQKIDDNGIKNKEVVQPLLTGDIFAVLPIDTLLFTGADDLVAAGIPTFGWMINGEWGGTKQAPKANLFGQEGSYLGIEDANAIIPYLAKKLGLHKVGILAYGVPQSADCAKGTKAGIEKWGPTNGVEVAFSDSTLAFGEKNLAVQVGRMKDAGVDFVSTCLDTNGVVTLATEMDKQGMKATQYLPNGYDHDFVKAYGDLFDGSIVRTSFATVELPADQQPQGLKDLVTWIGKGGGKLTENAITGWMNANQFVDGLKAAGPDFTRAKVIAAVNAMTNWNSNGISPGVDWSVRHYASSPSSCAAFSVIKNSTFVPDLGEPGKPFLCVDSSGTELVTSTKS